MIPFLIPIPRHVCIHRYTPLIPPAPSQWVCCQSSSCRLPHSPTPPACFVLPTGCRWLSSFCLGEMRSPWLWWLSSFCPGSCSNPSFKFPTPIYKQTVFTRRPLLLVGRPHVSGLTAPVPKRPLHLPTPTHASWNTAGGRKQPPWVKRKSPVPGRESKSAPVPGSAAEASLQDVHWQLVKLKKFPSDGKVRGFRTQSEWVMKSPCLVKHPPFSLAFSDFYLLLKFVTIQVKNGARPPWTPRRRGRTEGNTGTLKWLAELQNLMVKNLKVRYHRAKRPRSLPAASVSPGSWRAGAQGAITCK